MPKMLLETKLNLYLRSIGINIKISNSSNIFLLGFPTINRVKYIGVGYSRIKRVLKNDMLYKNLFFKS